jgi:hydrogenase maturation protein HypF
MRPFVHQRGTGPSPCARSAPLNSSTGDQRFHTEPRACRPAPPAVLARTARPAGSGQTGEPALRQAVATIGGGRIVAVNGLDGYQP